MPGFFPSIHAAAAASRLKVPATIKANFQTPHIEELQGAEAPSCALTKSKRKIKSVAALLFLFLKPYFIITFFLHSEFSWWYYLLAFLRASPRHFLCCRMVPEMAVALKKVHFFMIILYQAKQATLY